MNVKKKTIRSGIVKINRRDFLKWTVAASVALKVNLDMDKFNTVLAAESDPPVIWLQGAGCTGCTMSTLNVTNPTTIDDVLLNKISMKYNSTIMTASGETAIQALEDASNNYNGQFILVIEGAIPSGAKKNYCTIGKLNGSELSMEDALIRYATKAKYVVAAGACSSFGGVAAAAPNDANCATVENIIGSLISNPVVNIPGCPVHPKMIIDLLLQLFLVGMPRLDRYNRPVDFYGENIHTACERRGTTAVKKFGEYGCYKNVGCKGQGCKGMCSVNQWNDQSYCMKVNYPCIGCASPDYPTNPLTI